MAPGRSLGPTAQCLDGGDDMRGVDAVLIEQFRGRSGARQIADAEMPDLRLAGQGRGHGLAQAAGLEMVLDDDRLAAGFADRAADPVRVQGFDRIGVDDPDRGPSLRQRVGGLEGLEDRDARRR